MRSVREKRKTSFRAFPAQKVPKLSSVYREAPQTFRVFLSAVDQFGNVIPRIDPPYVARWVWRESEFGEGEQKEKLRHPQLRFWILLPEGAGPQKGSPVAQEAKSSLIDWDPADWPASFKLASGSKSVKAAIWASDVQSVIPMALKDGSDANLVLRLTPSRTEHLVDPSCKSFGVDTVREYLASASQQRMPDLKTPPLLFTAIACQQGVDSGDIELIIFHSGDAQVAQSTLGEPKRSAPQYQVYSYANPKKGVSIAVSLGSVEIRPRTLGGEGEDSRGERITIVFMPSLIPSRWGFSFGTGLTFLQYRETPVNLSLTQAGLSLKTTVDYTLIPRRLDTSVSAFITALPFAIAPTGTAAARFFGLNTRIGMNLPVRLGAIEWRLLTGWYFWGMLVPDNAYGVSMLSGPQLFLEVTSQKVGRRSWILYGKFAPISDRLSVQLSNRELAFGGSFQLNSPLSARTWLLTGDVAFTSFTASEVQNAMEMMSASLGVSYRY